MKAWKEERNEVNGGGEVAVHSCYRPDQVTPARSVNSKVVDDQGPTSFGFVAEDDATFETTNTHQSTRTNSKPLATTFNHASVDAIHETQQIHSTLYFHINIHFFNFNTFYLILRNFITSYTIHPNLKNN
ncbi:hypothetical protein V5E97_02565 [Singulisphaera sp. Ch08]|uniref:Uncharacterized protein n=1 Tax=Singulisphaera sp. Ch08 TaxID=3120278 RepID=A0AAU7CID5_9BACT